jgi:hypothetical protein
MKQILTGPCPGFFSQTAKAVIINDCCITAPATIISVGVVDEYYPSLRDYIGY